MSDLGESSCTSENIKCFESVQMETCDDNLSEGQPQVENRDFTTEIFKIRIDNLPKCYSICVRI